MEPPPNRGSFRGPAKDDFSTERLKTRDIGSFEGPTGDALNNPKKTYILLGTREERRSAMMTVGA